MAALVLVVGALGTLATIDTANSKTVATRGREAATSLARQLIEDVNNIPFRQLSQTGIAADLQSNQGLESAPGSGSYTITRRGFTYAITVSVCSLDDPRDWSVTGGLEVEPVGAIRYLLGIRSWY